MRIRRHPLSAFFVLACGISWAMWAPLWLPAAGITALPVLPFHHALGAFGPLLAAFIVSAAEDGRQGISTLARRMVLWRGRLRWIAVAIGGPAIVMLVALAIAWAVTDVPPPISGVGTSREFTDWPAWAFFAYNVASFGYGEETGWRGFAFPRLRARRTPLAAALLLTTGWAAWHLPLFYYRPGYVAMSGPEIVGWFLSLATGSILLAWLYERSGGSILVAALFHAAVDVVFTSDAATGIATTAAGALITIWGIAVVPTLLRQRPPRGASS